MAKKNVVVVGYGGMGGWHTRMIGGNKLVNDGYKPPENLENGSDCVNLKGIYDIKEERCKLAEERGIHAYHSFEEVLADPEVDILTLAVPNDCHKDLAIRAMAAGKHVISEKPVTLCSADLQEMIDASEKYGRLFTVHQNRRWDADFLAFKEIYESGKMGYVFNIESRVHGSRGIPGDWRQRKAYGGGMMLDWGVHLIDQMFMMIPEKVASVYARMDHITNDEVDDGFKMGVTFESGLVYRIEVGTTNFINLPRWYMQGAVGTAVLNSWDLNDGEIVIYRDEDEGEIKPVVTAAGLTKTMAPRKPSTLEHLPIPQLNPDVHDFYRNVCKAIDGEEPQIVTHPQMMRVMKLMEAAFESDRLGKPVPFEV